MSLENWPLSEAFEASRAWLERAQRVTPLSTHTLSKTPTQFVQGAVPNFLVRGKGARVWDVDGNEYLDYPMALGPILLGHADERVAAAIRRQLDDGITFTLPHPVEVEAAERIVAMCPGVEAVRFGKTGSDALSGAVRAARALTGRDRVLVAGYHGWHDWFIGSTTRNAGVPNAVQDLVETFRFNDLHDLGEKLAGDDIAAVVLEPSHAVVPDDGFLQGVVDLSRRHGALSIFDEIITGFRLAPGGARERYGVIPDVSTYGKAMANGMPVSAIGGAWETMRAFEEIFYSGTHGGETLSLTATVTVLDLIADGEILAGIHALGQRLLGELRERIAGHDVGEWVTVGGEPERTVIGFVGEEPLVVKSWVQQSLAQAGILFNGSMFISASHTSDDIGHTLDALDAAFKRIASGDDLRSLLVGPPVEAVFREP